MLDFSIILAYWMKLLIRKGSESNEILPKEGSNKNVYASDYPEKEDDHIKLLPRKGIKSYENLYDMGSTMINYKRLHTDLS